MFFKILKGYARLALPLICRRIRVNKPSYLNLKGPVLFAANHPNSFLDGMILTTLLEENLYSLARGDAFKQKKYEKILRWLHLLPVYRTSEGVENLTHNYTTFKACQDVFEKKGMVMIFSEGRCINEWHLRPLKKGTARLATSSWQKGIDLQVIPVGLNYNTFRNFGKNIDLNFGSPIDKEEVMKHLSDGKLFQAFNDQLRSQLENLVYEIKPGDKKTLREKLYATQSFPKKIALAPFALAGFIAHAPLYFLIKGITKYFFDNDHFDSVVASLLLLIYPFFLLAAVICIAVYFGWVIGIISLLTIPLSAWACVQLKNQLD